MIRRWEFRQRKLAHGAWGRFRAALARAERAYSIDEATAERLFDEGFDADVGGRDLVPPRTVIWITSERAGALEGARALALRLDAGLLAACVIALVPFVRDERRHPPRASPPDDVAPRQGAPSSSDERTG